jgi:hypothetical protein
LEKHLNLINPPRKKNICIKEGKKICGIPKCFVERKEIRLRPFFFFSIFEVASRRQKGLKVPLLKELKVLF